MKYLAGVELSMAEYMQLAALCQGDPQFPATWQEWNDSVVVAIQAAAAEGLPTSKLLFEVDAFQAWCARVGVLPSFDSVRAYALLARTPMAKLWDAGERRFN